MTNIANLIVCGDSFNTIGNIRYQGTHWSELVAKELGLNLLNLAMRGCSSRAICYQMRDALRRPNSIVIAGMAASPLRIETTNTPEEFGRDILKFQYPIPQTHPLINHSNLDEVQHVRSSPIGMLDNKDVQNVFLSKVCIDILTDIDKWVLLANLRMLKNKKIPFLFFEQLAGDAGAPITLEEYLDFIDIKDLILKTDLDPFSNYYNHGLMTQEEIDRLDPGYHTHPDEQKRIAEYIVKRLKAQFNL